MDWYRSHGLDSIGDGSILKEDFYDVEYGQNIIYDLYYILSYIDQNKLSVRIQPGTIGTLLLGQSSDMQYKMIDQLFNISTNKLMYHIKSLAEKYENEY